MRMVYYSCYKFRCIAYRNGTLKGDLYEMVADFYQNNPGCSDDMARVLDDGADVVSVKHAVNNAGQAQSVLDGIDPKYFNEDSRFGGGFYVGTDSDTIVSELAEHGNTAKYAIRYDMNTKGQKILDLTDSHIASEWDYVQGDTSTQACQIIGEIARQEGYNGIKFQSYRGSGTNYVIFNNHDSILSARMIMPID